MELMKSQQVRKVVVSWGMDDLDIHPRTGDQPNAWEPPINSTKMDYSSISIPSLIKADIT